MGRALFPPCSLAWGHTMIGLMATSSKRTYANMLHLPALPLSVSLKRGRLLSTHTSAGDSQTFTEKSGSVSCGVPAPFSWVLMHTLCVCVCGGVCGCVGVCPPRVSISTFLWEFCNKVLLNFESDSMRILSLFVRYPDCEACCRA